MTIHIFGSTGLVGRHLARYLIESDEDIRLAARNPNSVKYSKTYKFDLQNNCKNYLHHIKEGDTIVFCSAISSPKFCEENVDFAIMLNVHNTINVIKDLLERGCRVIFLSSDAVYGETINAKSENDLAVPFGLYGRMKRNVEEYFTENKNFKALRLSLVFSLDDAFCEHVFQCEAKNENVAIYEDYMRCVVHINDVCEGIYKISKDWESFPWRIINFGGPKLISKVKVFDHIKSLCKLKISAYTEIESENFFHYRAKSINMDSSRLKNILERRLIGIGE